MPESAVPEARFREKYFLGGFEDLYRKIDGAFDGRESIVYPEKTSFFFSGCGKTVLHVQEVLRRLMDSLSTSHNESYRISRGESDTVVCETISKKRLVFEIDSRWRFIRGTGIPLEIYQFFMKTR